MNNEPKISLTIVMEGSTLVRKSERVLISYQITKKEAFPNQKWGEASKEIFEKGVRTHFPREPKEIKQHINISNFAYNYMTSDEAPHFVKKRDWERLTKKQRLEIHLQSICSDLKGISFSYETLE